MTLRRVVRAVRPLEWVTLGFIVVVTVLVGPRVALEGASRLFASRSREAFLALLVVLSLQQMLLATRGKWADASNPLRLKLLVLLPVAMLPLLIGLGTDVFDRQVWDRVYEGADAFVVIAVLLVVLRIVGFGAPTLLVWLGLWRYAREHGRIDAGPFAKLAVRGVVTQVRDWLPFLLLISGYAWVGNMMELRATYTVDAALRALDTRLFGVDPMDALEKIISRPLSVWLATAYTLYAVLYSVCPSVVWLTKGPPAFRELAFAAGLTMALGWFGYLIFPAKGPVLTRTFSVPLDLYYIEPIKIALMDTARATYDCFPSMHTAVTMVFWAQAWRHARPLFWVMAPIAVSMPLACVYLRYHYVVDVLAGLALAAAVTALSNALSRRERVSRSDG